MVVEASGSLLPARRAAGVILALENHYKDNYWTYPEFAQHLPVFRRIVEAIDSPWFGVNYDPSNAILAGEDPLEVLDAVKERVVSMHASDRGLRPGYSLEDLRAPGGECRLRRYPAPRRDRHRAQRLPRHLPHPARGGLRRLDLHRGRHERAGGDPQLGHVPPSGDRRGLGMREVGARTGVSVRSS